MNPAEVHLDWQIATISAFVVKSKRERYIDKVSSTKKRGQFVANLSHFSDFDSRFIARIAPSSQHASDIESLIRAKGAPELCLAISEISAIDSRLIPLADALKKVVGRQMGTILCCIPGQLAYFENEDDRFILEHKTSQR